MKNLAKGKVHSSIELNKLVALFEAGKHAELEKQAQVLIKLYPDSGFLWQMLGVSLQMQGKDGLPALKNATELLPDNAGAHNNLGKALKDHGRLSEALVCYRRVSEITPYSAVANNNLGVALSALGQNEEAIIYYREALALNPYDADVHNNLGDVLIALNRNEEAVACYRASINLRPDKVDAHNSLGVALNVLNQNEEAVTCYRKAVILEPNYAEAHINLGITLNLLKQNEEAVASYQRAITIMPASAEAHLNLAIIFLMSGLFREGWKEYWWRFYLRDESDELGLTLSAFPLIKTPDELLTLNIMGSHLLLLKEQGLGDELFFLRFVKVLQKRGAWVAYVADSRIANFIRRAELVDYVAEENEVLDQVKVAFSIGDLPLMLGMASETDIPPPVPLSVLSEKWEGIALRLKSQRSVISPLIGITWRAGTEKKREGYLFKEIPLEQLVVVLREIKATFVIVQRNPRPEEITILKTVLGQSVLNFSDLNNDLEGMLALMSQLDDYIGVSNTNMHLRASVGKTAHVLVPNPPEFRWMTDGDISPWFPGFIVYRMTQNGSWDRALLQLKHQFSSRTILQNC